jgi:hypothetical protein
MEAQIGASARGPGTRSGSWRCLRFGLALAGRLGVPGRVIRCIAMADLTHLELARRTGGPTVPFEARGRRSRRLGWFGDVDRLAVVSTGDVGTADLALAHGLAWAGDRHLRLVLSAGTEQATLERAAFLSVGVEVWIHASDGTVSYREPLTRANVLARFAGELRGQDLHDPGHAAEWVDALVSWADSAPGLMPAHRQSYLAWQCHGRLVLRIQRRRGGLVAQAGKDWGTPPPGEPEPVTVELTTAATSAKTMTLIAAAARAPSRSRTENSTRPP